MILWSNLWRQNIYKFSTFVHVILLINMGYPLSIKIHKLECKIRILQLKVRPTHCNAGDPSIDHACICNFLEIRSKLKNFVDAIEFPVQNGVWQLYQSLSTVMLSKINQKKTRPTFLMKNEKSMKMIKSHDLWRAVKAPVLQRCTEKWVFPTQLMTANMPELISCPPPPYKAYGGVIFTLYSEWQRL